MLNEGLRTNRHISFPKSERTKFEAWRLAREMGKFLLFDVEGVPHRVVTLPKNTGWRKAHTETHWRWYAEHLEPAVALTNEYKNEEGGLRESQRGPGPEAA